VVDVIAAIVAVVLMPMQWLQCFVAYSG